MVRYYFFLKHRSFPLRYCSILWDINFSTESSDVPCLFILKTFRCQKLFETERTMYKVFRHSETKDFQRKLLISRSYAKNVLIPEFIWNTEGVPYEFFQRCETNIFWIEIIDMPLLCIRLSDTPFFLKHRGVLLRNVSVRWDKTVCTENHDTRPLSYH